MTLKCGVLCSGEGLELAALIEATESGRLPLEIKMVVTDRDSPALNIARNAGLYGAFVPRTAFHENRDGYERRLIQVLTEAGAETVILAGFSRDLGPVFEAAFPGRILGRDLGPEDLISALEQALRGLNIRLIPAPASGEEQ